MIQASKLSFFAFSMVLLELMRISDKHLLLGTGARKSATGSS